jgi:hypothetical protein
MTATLVVVPTIAPDTATVTSMTTATIPVLDVLFFTRWLSLCSPSSSRNPKGVVPNTESIRVFAKGVGLLLAIQDNVRDCCERCYLKVARPMITILLSTEVLTKERLAPSPLWETVISFGVLLYHRRDTMHAP